MAWEFLTLTTRITFGHGDLGRGVTHPHPTSPSVRRGGGAVHGGIGTQGVRPASGARHWRAEELRAFALGYYLSHLRRNGAPRAFGKVWRRNRGELDRDGGGAEGDGVCHGFEVAQLQRVARTRLATGKGVSWQRRGGRGAKRAEPAHRAMDQQRGQPFARQQGARTGRHARAT